MGIINIDLNKLALMIILMKKIVILLFLSDFWLGILKTQRTKKRDKRRINASSAASQ